MGLDRYSAWNCSFKISNGKIVIFPPFVTECSYLIFANLPGVGASYLGVRTLPRDWWCLDGVRVYREPPVLPQSPCDHLWRHILERKKGCNVATWHLSKGNCLVVDPGTAGSVTIRGLENSVQSRVSFPSSLQMTGLVRVTENYFEHGRMFSGVPGLHLLDTSNPMEDVSTN